jgi:Flp pilus assembly secretin CpaC
VTTTTESAGQDKPDHRVSRTALILSVVLALALGGLAGVVIGWKVEQNRVKEDIANIRPVGQITAVNGDSVTVELNTSSGQRTYTVTDGTTVESATAGTSADVVKGATVLVKNKRGSGGKLEATEIIVLPDSTTFGK